MSSETAVAALLGASVAGAGLVLVFYSLVVSNVSKIYDARKREYLELQHDFEEQLKGISKQSKKEDISKLGRLQERMSESKKPPEYLKSSFSTIFILYIASILFSFLWLVSETQRVMIGDIVWLPFMFATIILAFYGVYIIGDLERVIKVEYKENETIIEQLKKVEKQLTIKENINPQQQKE